MTRTATCRCGQLSVTCTGEPVRVSVCHCLKCQQRSGSSFTAQARFPDSAVAIHGASKIYKHAGDSGAVGVFHFCPNRGLHGAEKFKMHQPVYSIFGSMSWCHTAPMLRKPLQEVRGNADIKRSIMLACKYIYARSFFVSHALESATKWTLKQVQGDVNLHKMFRLNSHSHAVTLNSFQGPSSNSKLTVKCPHD